MQLKNMAGRGQLLDMPHNEKVVVVIIIIIGVQPQQKYL